MVQGSRCPRGRVGFTEEQGQHVFCRRRRTRAPAADSGRLLGLAARSRLSTHPLTSVFSVEDAAAESEGQKGVWEKEEGLFLDESRFAKEVS